MFKKLRQTLSHIIGTSAAASRRQRRAGRRLNIASLEGRLVPTATFFVNTLADSVNLFDGVLSLREAVNVANTTPGPDVIRLAVPGVYRVQRLGLDNTNAAGDYDVTESLTVSGLGA